MAGESNMKDEYTSIIGEIMHKTSEAYLVKINNSDAIWIPRSVVLDVTLVKEDGTHAEKYELIVATWFTEKHDL